MAQLPDLDKHSLGRCLDFRGSQSLELDPPNLFSHRYVDVKNTTFFRIYWFFLPCRIFMV